MKRGALRGLLGVVLCATLLAAYFAPPKASEAVALSEHVRASGALTAAPSARDIARQPSEVLSIKSRDADPQDDTTSLFAAKAEAVPVVKAMPAAAPASAPQAAAPQAPTLPFRVLGRFTDGEQEGVFLQHNDQNLVVRVGDTIAEHYKVESLNGTTLTLRYEPLNQQQTLEVGGSN